MHILAYSYTHSPIYHTQILLCFLIHASLLKYLHVSIFRTKIHIATFHMYLFPFVRIYHSPFIHTCIWKFIRTYFPNHPHDVSLLTCIDYPTLPYIHSPIHMILEFLAIYITWRVHMHLYFYNSIFIYNFFIYMYTRVFRAHSTNRNT